MHIDIVPNRKAAPTILLRESDREGKKVRKRTLANLSSLPLAQIEAIRAVLRGEELRPVAQSFEITASRAQGHVQAVAWMMKRLGFASLIASRPAP
ncbi:transposase, IS4 family protein, partial [mine drainage metagenome]